MKANDALSPLDRTLGTWSVKGTHPLLPGRTIRGRMTFERIDDGAFIRMHSKMEDPQFPDGIALFGTDDDEGTCTMIYFDDRGVSRTYRVTFEPNGFTWSRDSSKFAQRFRVTFSADGRTMESEGTMKKEGGAWEPDLSLSYSRETDQ